MSHDTPQIYVVCLAAYNSGRLYGAWIDVLDEDKISEDIEAMLASSPESGAEEWAIHDTKGFGGIEIDKNENIEVIAMLGALIEEYGIEIVSAARDVCSTLGELKKTITDRYLGCFDTREDYAKDIIERTGELRDVPENLARYFDFVSFGSDLELGGDICTVRGQSGLHVFSN